MFLVGSGTYQMSQLAEVSTHPVKYGEYEVAVISVEMRLVFRGTIQDHQLEKLVYKTDLI